MSNITDTVALGERPTTEEERATVLAMLDGIPDENLIAQALGLMPS